MLSKLKTAPLHVWLIISVLSTAIVIICMAVIDGKAKAADKGKAPVTRAEAAAAAPTNPWTACHVGASAGVVAGVMDPIYGVDGYQYGGTLGCDVQIGQLVIGAATSYDWKTVTAFSTSVDTKQWDIGGRAGILVTPSTLVYGKLARATLYMDGDHTGGITIGGGVETMIHRDWRLALEYGRSTFDDLADARAHTVAAHLKYAFTVPGLNR